MDKDLLQTLRQRNGYCECPGLQDLYATKRKAERLEEVCNRYGMESDLKDPREEDREFLERYRDHVEDFNRAVKDYYRQMNQDIARENLYFILHLSKALSREETARLLKQKVYQDMFSASSIVGASETERRVQGESPLLTIHCSSCDQQVDILTSSG
jgi:hypothetical protein